MCIKLPETEASKFVERIKNIPFEMLINMNMQSYMHLSRTFFWRRKFALGGKYLGANILGRIFLYGVFLGWGVFWEGEGNFLRWIFSEREFSAGNSRGEFSEGMRNSPEHC